MHAGEDTFVGKHHSEQLAAAYAGDKNIVLVDGDLNSGGCGVMGRRLSLPSLHSQLLDLQRSLLLLPPVAPLAAFQHQI